MQQVICSVIGNSVRLVVALTLLLHPACVLVAPQTGHAQNIPMPGNPTIVGTWCPRCGGYIDMPNGKLPSVCPHKNCGYSFVQQPKPDLTPKPAIFTPKKAAGRNAGVVETRKSAVNSIPKPGPFDPTTTKQAEGNFKQTINIQEQGFYKERQDLLSIHTSMHTYVQDQKTNRSSYSTPKVRKLGPLSALSIEELKKRYKDDTNEIDRIVLGAKRRGENEARRQVTRDGDEANIQEAGENWNNEKKEFAGNMGFAMAGELAHEAGDKMAENAIGITDQGRGILGGGSDSSPNVAEQNQKDQSGSYDVVKSEGTHNQPWSPGKKSYNPGSSQDFKDGVILNEFTNVDLTTLGNSHHRPSNWDAEWKQAAASTEAPHPQLIASRDAPENFNLSDAVTVGETALSFAGPEAGLALTSGKFLIANGVALGNHSIYGNSVNQGTAFDEGSAQYAKFYTQRLIDLRKDQEDIKAELAHRLASGGE